MLRTLSFLVVGILSAGAAAATSYTDRTSFYAALNSYTVIDTSSYIGKFVDEIDPDFAGVSFFGPRSYVRSDDLILNGQGFFGTATPHVGLNFAKPIQGAGVTTNAYDGGDVVLYSGLNGTGTELGRADFGDSLVLFGGLVISGNARSAVFTCDFNSDLKCGLRDIAFGTNPSSGSTAVPLPAAGALMLLGVGTLGAMRMRRNA
ncbi:VPLPA-CTERM sorting domain-containing protein [Fluviibacterium sp. DFM31]|uniref:VPLPA-CTERM sorting domain-containing protein n=1 Tax=Meridianimarinicoccus marinus TaxID=3231483 RepID=A0ABV3L1J1_9RHOB